MVLSLIPMVFPIWGAIDAALKPESAWQAADQNKFVWVILQALGVFVAGLGLIPILVYLFAIRPKVKTQMR